MIDILLTEEQKLFRKTLRNLGEKEILPFALDWDENDEQSLRGPAEAYAP